MALLPTNYPSRAVAHISGTSVLCHNCVVTDSYDADATAACVYVGGKWSPMWLQATKAWLNRSGLTTTNTWAEGLRKSDHAVKSPARTVCLHVINQFELMMVCFPACIVVPSWPGTERVLPVTNVGRVRCYREFANKNLPKYAGT